MEGGQTIQMPKEKVRTVIYEPLHMNLLLSLVSKLHEGHGWLNELGSWIT
jgi:uncharacterized protein (DUF2132 family)